MARYRRRRTFKKRFSKWAPNIAEFNANDLGTAVGKFSNNIQLTYNPAQSTQLVSQTYTVKNIEITFTFEATGAFQDTAIEALCVYIMYVPQGMNIGDDYNIQHPEYIMAYKYIGSPIADGTTSQAQPTRVRSRLARKLQTGDSIILYITGYNQSTTPAIPLEVSGLVRWWTKAN